MFCAELNKKNVLRVGFSPAASYSPLEVMNTDGPDEGGRLWHLVRNQCCRSCMLVTQLTCNV